MQEFTSMYTQKLTAISHENTGCRAINKVKQRRARSVFLMGDRFGVIWLGFILLWFI